MPSMKGSRKQRSLEDVWPPINEFAYNYHGGIEGADNRIHDYDN